MAPPDDLSRDAQRFLERKKQQLAQRRAEVAEAKQKAAGKEPFAFDAFARAYDVRDDHGEAPLDQDDRDAYEWEYYVMAPAVRTIAEFAEFRRNQRLNDAG